MWDTLLGGLFAIVGGWWAIRYQLQNTRKQRMDEVTAERKVEVNSQAYSKMKHIEGSFGQAALGNTLDLVKDSEQWFFENRLFLPGQFPKHWLSIRNDLHKLIRWQRSKSPEELENLEQQIEKNISNALDEIYKDMDIERIELGKNS